MNFKKLTYLCMQRLTNFPYIEEDFDALTNYELLCKVVEYLNQVIANENNQNEAIEELATSFTELKNYVDNLDLQDEVNNKLDEMYENGQLSDLVAQYLGLAGMITFDTVADMKSAENLVNGSKCATLGYHSVNDGGEAIYKVRTITNDDVVDEASIIALNDNSLIAELILINDISVNAFGCYGDNIHDDTEKFQIALNKSLNIKLNENSNYKISSTLTIRNNTKLTGAGTNSKITSYIDNGSAIFYNNQNVLHFIFQDFYIDGNDKNCYGFIFINPYDNCIFKNLFFDNFTKSCLKLGDNTTISQTLLIDNCCVYMSAEASLDTPIFHLIKCYESNILNNKLLNRQNNYNDAPCLLLENIYDNNIQGNSFTCSHECGIKITGECRHNRIISNTYELIDGTYAIKMIGSSSSSILHTLIIEAFTYYSAPKKMYCENEANGFIIGIDVEGGRRNMVFNINSDNIQSPYGNCIITADNQLLTSKGFGINNYSGIKKYEISSNEGESVDYGLDFKNTDLNKKFTIDLSRKYFGTDIAGGKIRLISPDGNTTKYLGINDSGEITLYNYPN